MEKNSIYGELQIFIQSQSPNGHGNAKEVRQQTEKVKCHKKEYAQKTEKYIQSVTKYTALCHTDVKKARNFAEYFNQDKREAEEFSASVRDKIDEIGGLKSEYDQILCRTCKNKADLGFWMLAMEAVDTSVRIALSALHRMRDQFNSITKKISDRKIFVESEINRDKEEMCMVHSHLCNDIDSMETAAGKLSSSLAEACFIGGPGPGPMERKTTFSDNGTVVCVSEFVNIDQYACRDSSGKTPDFDAIIEKRKQAEQRLDESIVSLKTVALECKLYANGIEHHLKMLKDAVENLANSCYFTGQIGSHVQGNSSPNSSSNIAMVNMALACMLKSEQSKSNDLGVETFCIEDHLSSSKANPTSLDDDKSIPDLT
jgi:hypothetical protein